MARRIGISGTVAAVAPAATLRVSPLDAASVPEVNASSIAATTVDPHAFFAHGHRHPRGLAQFALLADRTARGFEHFEQSLVQGLRLHLVGAASRNLAEVLRGGQHAGALPSGHRRGGTETHRSSLS